MSNVIRANFNRSVTCITAPAYQYDYGQILVTNLDLPEAYEVHFSNEEKIGTAITQIGNKDGVSIPDEFFLSGDPVYAWIFLHTTETDGETEYFITIPVIKKSKPTGEEPTPVQQSVIDQAIAALNIAVDKAEQMANTAGYMTLTIDENGHLIYTKTIETPVDFEIDNDHLYAEVK